MVEHLSRSAPHFNESVRVTATIVALALSMPIAAAIGLDHVVGAALLALLSFVWLTVDSAWEGGVLIHLDAAHGLTQADLAGVMGFVVAIWELWRLRRP